MPEWKSTYDKHKTAEAAHKDMQRRQKWARQVGHNTSFRVVRKGDFYIVEYHEG